MERNKLNKADIASRISTARSTLYSLMGAGLHGINGINPLVSMKLWRIYVIPRLLYGIEVLHLTQQDIHQLERFQKKVFKQILSLSTKTADAAVYILLGAETIEQIIHKMAIGLFLRIAKNTNSIEHQLAIRQLALKNIDSKSWFVKINNILRIYNLPSAYEIILQPKKNWKFITHDEIDKTWRNKWTEQVESKTTLKYLQTNHWDIRKPHFCWKAVSDQKRDVQKGIIKSKLLTGTYKTQTVIHKFDNAKTTICQLCHNGEEDYEHFLLHCDKLDTIRTNHKIKLIDYMKYNNIPTEVFINSNDKMLRLLLDCCTQKLIPQSQRLSVDKICRDWIFALHSARCNLL